MGLESEDGRYAHCGAIPSGHPDKNGQTWAHWLNGPCDCGEPHGVAPRLAIVRTPAKPNTKRTHKRFAPIARHVYENLDGSVRFSVARFYRGHAKPAHYPVELPKCMSQREDGRGDWYDGLEGAPYEGLYRLPQLVASDIWEPVFVVGGELCADAVAAAGGVATCNAGGEGKWRDWYNDSFRARNVVILADADETGERHAQLVAGALASFAATVRVVTLEGAHDVADWLDAGHTGAELRAIAAHAPIITARMPQSRIGPVTLQDEMSSQTPQICPNCHQWQDRARIAETTVQNLRAERVIEDKYLAIPNEKLSAPVKLAALALRRELNEQQHNPMAERDEERRPRIYRAAIARRTGTKEAAAGGSLQKVAAAQLFERREKRSADDTKTFYAPGPHFNQPEAIAEPERANTWGGKRIRKCLACGSANLETRVICRECGTVQSAEDTNKPEPPDDTPDGPQSRIGPVTLQDDATYADVCEEEEETQAQAQEYLPFANTTVRNLAPDAGASDVLALAEACGWPALQIGHLRPLGELGWRSVMRAATPDQIATTHTALVTQHQAALSGGAKE